MSLARNHHSKIGYFFNIPRAKESFLKKPGVKKLFDSRWFNSWALTWEGADYWYSHERLVCWRFMGAM